MSREDLTGLVEYLTTAKLTQRQVDIAIMANSHTAEEIADMLGIGRATVRAQIRKIRQKLDKKKAAPQNRLEVTD